MLILAAIAIPALVASIQSGHEAAAVGNLKEVVTASAHYRELWPTAGYPAVGKDLGMTGGNSACPATPDTTATGSVAACLIADGIAVNLDGGSGATPINGYNYLYKGSTNGNLTTSFTLTAVPVSTTDGRKSFCTDASGTVIYQWVTASSLTAPANTVGVSCSAPDMAVSFPLGS